MNDTSYDAAPFAVREDLAAAHRRAWDRIARPGTWWTGGERVAIAAETRNAPGCALCRESKAALSPFAVKGDHDSLGALPGPVIEIIHRLRNDPGRLTRQWYEGVVADVGDARYVEIVGVVVTVVGVDVFARAIGVEPRSLPTAAAGEPSRLRPGSAKPSGAWVPMIAVEDAEGPEADLYGSRAFVPNVRKALSLVPAEVRSFFGDLGDAHYFDIDEMMDIMKERAISRAQIELLAARVSALNQCFY
jgi:hypothetical protein